MESNRQNYDSLTGLKGLMSLVIVWFHTLPVTPQIEAIPFSSMIRYFGGNVGNSVFFMISGFLMANFYQQRLRSREISFGSFLTRKVCKFYPVYLLTNILALILEAVQHGLSVITVKHVALTLLLQEGGILGGGHPYNGPTWFVNMLLVCNIMYYAVCRFAGNRTAYRCALAGMIIWGYAAATQGLSLPFFHFRIGIGFMNFFMGCVIAEVYPQISRRTHSWLRPVALLLLAGSVVLMVHSGVDNALGEMEPALALGLSPLILYSALANPLFRRPLCTAPMRYLGKISVSVYYWHVLVFNALRYILILTTGSAAFTDVQYLFYLVLMLTLSILAFRFLENGLFRNFGKAKA